MSDIVMAIGFVVVVTGGVLALLLGMYLEYRQNVARIASGVPADPGGVTGIRRVLGWGLGFTSAGTGLFIASIAFGLPGETGSEGQGAGVVLAVIGAAMLAYVFVAPRIRS